MKKIALALTILTLFHQETNAAERPGRVPFRQICAEIDSKVGFNDDGAVCIQVSRKYQLPSISRSICDNVINKYKTDIKKGRSYCEDQFRNLHSEDNTVLPTFDKVVHLPPPQLRQSIAADQCEEKTFDDFVCKIDSDLMLPDITSIYKSLSTMPIRVTTSKLEFSPEKCSCLEASVRKSNAVVSIFSLEGSLAVEKSRINDLILNAAGKKLINDFASNLEDFNFFETNNPKLLGKSQNREQVACNKFESFRNTIMERCRLNDIDASVAESRLDTLMNSLGDLGSSTSAEQRFNSLKNDILTYHLNPSKVFPGRSTTYTRQAYDRFRYGMYKTRPEVKFVNDITDRLLDSETLGPDLLKAIQDGTPPGKAIYQILTNEDNPETNRILKKYIRENKGSAFHMNLKAVLETSIEEDFDEFILNAWDVATDMHPGLKAIFNNDDLFLATREKTHISGSHSLLETLDATGGSLAEYFQERCTKLKNDFAEAACTPDGDYIKRASRSDLAELLSSVDSQLNPAVTDIILCRMTPPESQESIFTRLAFKPSDRIDQADYFLMKVNPENIELTRFAQVAYGLSSGDEKTFRALSQITETGDAFRDIPELAPQVNSESPQIASTERLSTLNEIFQETVEKPEKIVPEQQLSNYLAPQLAPAIKEENPTNNEFQTKDLLRDYLANKDNEEEIESLLKNTSSKDHEELLKLRSELENSRSKILDLMKETEQQKLANLKEDYERLEREAKVSPQSASRKESLNRSEVSQENAPAAPSPMIPNMARGGSSETSGAATNATSGSTSRGPGIRRSIASEDSESGNSPSSGQAIIIESSKLQANDSTAREDISKEVIAYIKAMAPDINTLKQLKESGIIIKYKIIEEGREVLKEIRVDYSSLSAEAKQVLEQKLNKEERLITLQRAKRAYSYSALKHLLGLKVQSSLE